MGEANGNAYESLARHTEPMISTDLPGPKGRAVIDADAQVTSPSLPRAYSFVPDRGAGAVIKDVDDNVFLDFNAGIAVCSTGHAHPAVVGAIEEQAAKLLHYSASDFYLPVYAEMCARLADIAPMDCPSRVFLTNSGTEAVEAAIKLARHNTGRQYIMSFFGSFHGRSYGSVSLTASKANYRADFGPLLPGVLHAPYAGRFDSFTGLAGSGDFGGEPAEPDLDYINDVIFKRLAKPHEVAAIVVEPILGEGGYVVPPRSWLLQLRNMCDAHGILFVADEVQSGIGRTGSMWAMQHFDLQPDIVLTGKGIASGMPLGGMVARAGLMTWPLGTHGSTYGGNPVSCAAGLATLDLVAGGLMDNARTIGDFLMAGLKDLEQRQPAIQEVRGLGLMIGVELPSPLVADAIEIAAFKKGLLVLRAGDSTIRMAPPLIMNREQAAAGLRLFEEACAEGVAKSAGLVAEESMIRA
ncbi:MAG: aminotransferase class III-fold pyridoxal phosphate-dependent enzyme [Actinobacteria bacterium]|nr:aminotransferase class III-fold pyridoxal phosphate-dependent enzyme [Actinomycetota bacterium]